MQSPFRADQFWLEVQSCGGGGTVPKPGQTFHITHSILEGAGADVTLSPAMSMAKASFPSVCGDNEPQVGCTLGFGAVFSAQLLARAGFDYLMIDMEHNPLSARDASSMVHAIAAASGGKCKPVVRVPSHGVEWIKWALDSGAAGIIVPMVTSAAQVEQIVQHGTYPPRGQRSFGPALAPFSGVDPTATVQRYLHETSKTISIIPMIESLEGYENAEAICSNDAISAVFIGPVDLRMSMGLAGGDGDEDRYLAILAHLVQLCHRASKPIGIFAAGMEACKKRANEGFDFLLVRSLGVMEPRPCPLTFSLASRRSQPATRWSQQDSRRLQRWDPAGAAIRAG